MCGDDNWMLLKLKSAINSQPASQADSSWDRTPKTKEG